MPRNRVAMPQYQRGHEAAPQVGTQSAVASAHGEPAAGLPGISNDSLAMLLILDTMFQTHLK